MKYIDADKLIAEIEKLKEEARKNVLIARDNDNTPVCALWAGKQRICTELLSIISSLQQEQPKVDLEKEVSNYLKIHHLHIKDGGRIVFENDDTPNFMCDIRDIAHHFYELGKNSK